MTLNDIATFYSNNFNLLDHGEQSPNTDNYIIGLLFFFSIKDYLNI